MPLSTGPPSATASVMPELADLEADLATAVSQVEKTPEPLCSAAGSTAEMASALQRVDKQFMAAQEDDPWGTGPAMRDWPAVQEERRRCATRRCESGPAMRDHPAVQVKRRRSAARRCQTGPAMRDRPAVQVKRRRSAARRCESGPAMRDCPAVQVKRQRSAAQLFVDANILSTPMFCRCPYFVAANILSVFRF
jgi:hypothetical protein